jgi:hypothetical protein
MSAINEHQGQCDMQNCRELLYIVIYLYFKIFYGVHFVDPPNQPVTLIPYDAGA